MFMVGKAVIDDPVSKASFCCDLPICKGACCCLAGGRGAPLEDDEVLEIHKAYPSVRPSLSEKSIAVIERGGLIDGQRGDYATMCIEQRECVFVYFDYGIAKCSFERAFLEGKTDWRKPISCHLFPVRVRRFGEDFLRYEVIEECEDGRAFGEQQNVKLHEFLKEPLTRKYGEVWYASFLDHCRAKAALE